MRIISWIRARYESTAALVIARQANRRAKRAEVAAEDLHDRLGDTDFRVIQLRQTTNAKLREITGPTVVGDQPIVSLREMRNLVCKVEQRICNAHAAITVLRDDAHSRDQRIKELERRLDEHEDRFASRADVLSAPSLN